MDYSGRFHFALAQTQSGNYKGEMGRGLSETSDSLGEMCKRVKREAAAAAAAPFVLVFTSKIRVCAAQTSANEKAASKFPYREPGLTASL